MNNDDLSRQIQEHADGREASPELVRALSEQPALRTELELARKHAAGLKRAFARARLSDADLERLHARIVADLHARGRSFRLIAMAVAATILLLLAGLGVYRLAFEAATPQSNDAVTPTVARVPRWKVERFSPSASEAMNVPVRTEQQLAPGGTLQLGQQEYAKLREADTGATWLAYPGARLSAGDTLELEHGAVELQSSPATRAEIVAAGRKYTSAANFSVSVEGAATLVCVYSGTVTQSEGEPLQQGRHAHGGTIDVARTEAWSAYAKGFEAWAGKDFASAGRLFGAAAEAPELESTARRYAHFYWFAAVGCEAAKAEAVRVGEAYLSRYGDDETVPYVRLFLGIYLVELGEIARARAHLEAVVAAGSAQLTGLAQSQLQQLDGGAAARAQSLWEAFYVDWQRQDYAACEASLRALLRECPGDASVVSGEAQFRLFGAVGNQGKLEEAIRIADEVLSLTTANSYADYVLYFKATYQHELGRDPAALETLARLEKQFPDSPMLKFAAPLREELKARK